MSERSNKSGTSNAGAFVLAGAVAALAIVIWVVFGGMLGQEQPDVSVTVPGVGTIEGNVDAN